MARLNFILEIGGLMYAACLAVCFAFVFYFMTGCSARIQNGFSAEWGDATGSAGSKMSIEQERKIEGAI